MTLKYVAKVIIHMFLRLDPSLRYSQKYFYNTIPYLLYLGYVQGSLDDFWKLQFVIKIRNYSWNSILFYFKNVKDDWPHNSSRDINLAESNLVQWVAN